MRAGTYFHPTLINLVTTRRGLGDSVCIWKVINTICKKWPHIYYLIYEPDYIVPLAKHFLSENKKVAVHSWSEKDKVMQTEPAKSAPLWRFGDQKVNSWRIPLMQHTYIWISDYMPSSPQELSYPAFRDKEVSISHFNLPENYACIITTSTIAQKEFKAETIEKITTWLLSKNVTPVYLGSTKQQLTADKEYSFRGSTSWTRGINLINKTDLLEAGAIMANAKVVIGMDGGLIHLAATTNVPIVAGFSIVNPDLFIPYRAGIKGTNFFVVAPDHDLECRYCLSQVNFVAYNDIEKECLYKDLKCLDQLSSQKFIHHIEKII